MEQKARETTLADRVSFSQAEPCHSMGHLIPGTSSLYLSRTASPRVREGSLDFSHAEACVNVWVFRMQGLSWK